MSLMHIHAVISVHHTFHYISKKLKSLSMGHLIKVLIVFCLFGSGISIQAQYSIPASGGNATGTGGSVSYTIGQVVYTSIVVPDGIITQGIQQPFEILVVTGTSETSDITVEASVYPNPVTEFVILKVKSYEIDNLSYRLFDMNGSLIQEKKAEGNETRIQMGKFLPGTYILKIGNNQKDIKTFKIIKNY